MTYNGIYPGIDAEWFRGTNLPMVRFTVAPGADPQQLLLRLQAGEGARFDISPYYVGVTSQGLYFSLTRLAAYQKTGASQSRLAVRFAQVDESSFRPVVDNYDSSLPLVIELGESSVGILYPSVSLPAYDDAVFLLGSYYRPYVAKVTRDGTPLFLSLFGGGYSPSLVHRRDGSLTLILNVSSESAPPVTPDAPRKVSGPKQDLWVGRLDNDGRLRAATFTGGPGQYAVDPEGAVFQFQKYPDYGKAHTLVAVNGNGSGVLYSESFPLFPTVSFDSRGNVLTGGRCGYANSSAPRNTSPRPGFVPGPFLFSKRRLDAKRAWS